MCKYIVYVVNRYLCRWAVQLMQAPSFRRQKWAKWVATAQSGVGPTPSRTTSTPACTRRATAAMWWVAVLRLRSLCCVSWPSYSLGLVFQDMYYVSVKALYTVGYSTSLVSLTMAMVILCRFRSESWPHRSHRVETQRPVVCFLHSQATSLLLLCHCVVVKTGSATWTFLVLNCVWLIELVPAARHHWSALCSYCCILGSSMSWDFSAIFVSFKFCCQLVRTHLEKSYLSQWDLPGKKEVNYYYYYY